MFTDKKALVMIASVLSTAFFISLWSLNRTRQADVLVLFSCRLPSVLDASFENQTRKLSLKQKTSFNLR